MKKADAALIRDAFNSLPDLEFGLRSGKAMLYEACLAAERAHRKGTNRRWGLTARQAARYFTVKWLRAAILEGWPAAALRPSSYLHLKPECLLTYALLDEPGLLPVLDRWLLTATWSDVAFAKLDYVALVRGGSDADKTR